MKNLAGDKDADKLIIRELTRCGVPIIVVPKTNSEVPYTIEGRLTVPGLGEFKFDRRWSYWACEGKLPLAIAEELYAMKHFQEIRSGGDCACRPPTTWATAYKGEQIVVTPGETKNVREGMGTSKIYADFAKNPDYYLCDTQAEYDTYPRFVQTYHIDSELGLYVFVQTLNKHALPD